MGMNRQPILVRLELLFRVANGARRFQAVHFWHLYIHENHVEGLILQELEHGPSRGCDSNRMPALLQDACGHSLIYQVVLREQDGES